MTHVHADGAQQVRVVVVNGFSDLMPDTYWGYNPEEDIEECFIQYKQWLLYTMIGSMMMLLR